LILKRQILIYLLFSIFIGFSFNFFRSFYHEPGIPLIAKELELTKDLEEALAILSEPRISEIDLQAAIEFHEKGVLFVDARSEEYLLEGIIPGAISNDNNTILSEQINDLIGYSKGFVVYCSDDDCGSSENLAYELQEFGFMNIFVFKGGWKEWTGEGLEIEIIADE
tara:strand:- start:115 stop:615 length:501 start_codon:yes stop_codon:yes gene_type:complete